MKINPNQSAVELEVADVSIDLGLPPRLPPFGDSAPFRATLRTEDHLKHIADVFRFNLNVK